MYSNQYTSLCSSDINGPVKSRSTSSMSLKVTLSLCSDSYTLKTTEETRYFISQQLHSIMKKAQIHEGQETKELSKAS